MKPWVCFILVICLIPGFLLPSESGVLEGVLRPSVIDVRNQRLFIMDMEKMHVFSLHPLEHKKTFGRKGEGPGEYPVLSGTSNRIRAYPDFLLHEALNKILLFDHEGRFLREQKKPPLIKNIHPVGDKFVGRRIYQLQDGTTACSAIQIYDRNLKIEKEIARQEFFQQGAGAELTFDMGYDMLIFDVAGEHIFVETSRKGPFIEVFDKSGSKLYRITIPWKKIPIAARDRKELLNYLIQDSRMQQIMKINRITWETLSRDFRFQYPEYYPAIRDMFIDSGRIFVKTWHRDQQGRDQHFILDLKGNMIKEIFLSPVIPFTVRSIGSGKLETIHRDKMYYLTENEEGEWSLRIKEIMI